MMERAIEQHEPAHGDKQEHPRNHPAHRQPRRGLPHHAPHFGSALGDCVQLVRIKHRKQVQEAEEHPEEQIKNELGNHELSSPPPDGSRGPPTAVPARLKIPQPTASTVMNLIAIIGTELSLSLIHI